MMRQTECSATKVISNSLRKRITSFHKTADVKTQDCLLFSTQQFCLVVVYNSRRCGTTQVRNGPKAFTPSCRYWQQGVQWRHGMRQPAQQPTPSSRHSSAPPHHAVPLYTRSHVHIFNFILNRTRSGRELFDRPSYRQTRGALKAWPK